MLPLALALFLAPQPAAAETADAAPAAAASPTPRAPVVATGDLPIPPGAPHEDYQFVGWCYGALRGYLDLHDQVMPEVTRIESEFRRPGSKLADDLKVYADEQAQARKDLKAFQAALTAAEKASVRPINALGAAAVAKGHAMWTPGPGVTKARLAQEWMSWTLPARCQTTAKALHDRAVLMGPAFKLNDETDAASTAKVGESPTEAKPADAPAPAEAEPAPDKPQG
jgi:hypothetical protein